MSSATASVVVRVGGRSEYAAESKYSTTRISGIMHVLAIVEAATRIFNDVFAVSSCAVVLVM
jgi:hypothetical protein